MSKAYALRQSIKDSIVAADLGLSAEDIIIKRQADLFTEIENSVSNAVNGVTLTISSGRKTNLTPELDKPRWQTRLSLRLWIQPVYHGSNKPEEEISEELENHLSMLVLDTSKPKPIQQLEKIKVLESDEVADPDYLVRELTITVIQQN